MALLETTIAVGTPEFLDIPEGADIRVTHDRQIKIEAAFDGDTRLVPLYIGEQNRSHFIPVSTARVKISAYDLPVFIVIESAT